MKVAMKHGLEPCILRRSRSSCPMLSSCDKLIQISGFSYESHRYEIESHRIAELVFWSSQIQNVYAVERLYFQGFFQTVVWSPFDFGWYLWRHLHGISLENQRCQLRIALLWNRITSNSWICVLIVSNSELLRCREILFSRLLSNRCLKHISSRISRWRLALSPRVRYTVSNCRAVKAVISGNWLLFHR